MPIATSFPRASKAGYVVLALLIVAAAAFFLTQGAAAFAVGQIITMTTKFRVMQTDLVTGVGLQNAGATGKIISGPKKGNKANQIWWLVDFDTGADGWVVQNVMTVSGTAKPVVTLSASPQSIVPGGSSTLTWSSTNATACTGTGAGFAGALPVSGSVSVKPGSTTSFGLSCTGSGGSGSAGVTVSVGVAPAVAVSLGASPTTVVEGAASTLTWSSTNATSCTAGGDAGFSGAVATAGFATVRPAATTSYTLSCSGPQGRAETSAMVSVTPSGVGSAVAFADPDNGGIPDRALHPIAFPTAVGFGKVTSVRSPNAVVYKINSLDDVADPNDNKITYRECALALAVNTPYAIPAGRPRYCVFDVSGAIEMRAPAQITTPKIYIAGQTSPGGIEFRLGSAYSPVDSLIDTRRGGDHMILRHVRTRTGDHANRKSQNGDPIRLSGTRFQILDHVSTMFGTDESLDMVCKDCTVQWSIIGPNICRNAGHTSSLHCKSFFLKPASNITIAYNLTQHGEQRGINIAGGTAPVATTNSGQLDIINNVMYHFVKEQGLVSNQFGDVYANYINNVSFRGPRYNASDGNFFLGLYAISQTPTFGFNVYSSGNVTPHTRVAGQFGQTVSDGFRDMAGLMSKVTANMVCALSGGSPDCSRQGKAVVQATAPAVAPGNTGLSLLPRQIVPAEQAMRDVMAFAGADMCRDGACRDNVDALYVDDLRTCDMAPYMFERDWASTVAQAGGWAQLTQGPAKADTDNDGMPDEWERRFRNTNPNLWDANADADGDGYPNIEEYLNAMARDDQRYSGLQGSGTGRVPAYNCNRPKFLPQ